jgi:glutathionylspermidine amidase/synthetase
VELFRRYYLIHYGLLISDVPNAKDLFSQRTLFNIRTGIQQFWATELNIGTKLPSPGSLLIWMPTKDFPLSGHVAVVTQVTKNYVYIIEQNYGTGRRRLPVRNGKIVSPGLIGWKDVPRLF